MEDPEIINLDSSVSSDGLNSSIETIVLEDEVRIKYVLDDKMHRVFSI